MYDYRIGGKTNFAADLVISQATRDFTTPDFTTPDFATPDFLPSVAGPAAVTPVPRLVLPAPSGRFPVGRVDLHLRGHATRLFDGTSGAYPEMRFEPR